MRWTPIWLASRSCSPATRSSRRFLLDGLREGSVRSERREGASIPAPTAPNHTGPDPEFDRLERAVSLLAERHGEALREVARLRERLEDREGRIRELDERVLDMNQRRQDVAKRIDDLVAQILLLENQLGRKRS